MKKRLFTLIEIVIAITITIIIIWAAWLNLLKVLSSSKDSQKQVNLNLIASSFENYILKNNDLPLPDSYTWIYDQSGAVVIYCWEIWSSVYNLLSNLNSIPKDPSTNWNYSYCISWDRKKYSIMITWEDLQTYFIAWNYKWYLYSISWSNYYFLNPSSLFVSWNILISWNNYFYINNWKISSNSMTRFNITDIINNTWNMNTLLNNIVTTMSLRNIEEAKIILNNLWLNIN